ncbi:hypothetical protein [Pseudorhodoplanes sp.]|uniref:hypothetical protein n=1 Tax=Pseudorhodoplanes sp. TaxID=1934341 RepID=UPI003919B5EE
MGEINDRERATISAFLDAIKSRLNDEDGRTVISSVIADFARGSRNKAFAYMNKVLRGTGD